MNVRDWKRACLRGALALAMVVGYAQAQERRPQVPEVESPAEPAQDTSPIAAEKKPNVVFILADNVGYGDLGPYGGGELRGAPTPRIDELAQQGLRFTQFLVEPALPPTIFRDRSCNKALYGVVAVFSNDPGLLLEPTIQELAGSLKTKLVSATLRHAGLWFGVCSFTVRCCPIH